MSLQTEDGSSVVNAGALRATYVALPTQEPLSLRASDVRETVVLDTGAHQRNPVLDGLRGLAILMVVVCHATRMPAGMYRPLLMLGHWGLTGVDLFFVLSGFLITGILFDAKDEEHYFRNFYARRVLRIFPLYYLCLVVALVIVPMLPAAVQAFTGPTYSGATSWTYWVYVSNFTLAKAAGHGRPAWLDPTWSLAVEEQFYIVWPLVVLVLSRRRLMVACGLLMVTAFAVRAGFVRGGADWVTIYMIPFCRMDALAAGALIALAMRDSAGRVFVRRAAIPGLCIAAITLLCIFRAAHWRMWTEGVTLMAGDSAVAMMYASLLALLLTWQVPLLREFFGSRVMRMFGHYSYAIYLLHLPVILLLVNFFAHDEDYFLAPSGTPMLLKYAMLLGLGLTIALGLAVVSWNLLESRCLALKKYFRSGPRVVLPVPPTRPAPLPLPSRSRSRSRAKAA